MPNEPVIFPMVRYFPPYKQYQPMPTIDGVLIEGCPCLPTQAEAAIWVCEFYLVASLPETIACCQEVTCPAAATADTRRNCETKLKAVTQKKVDVVRASARAHLKLPSVASRIDLYRQRIAAGAIERPTQPKIPPPAEDPPTPTPAVPAAAQGQTPPVPTTSTNVGASVTSSANGGSGGRQKAGTNK
jgi:hypothetical protein